MTRARATSTLLALGAGALLQTGTALAQTPKDPPAGAVGGRLTIRALQGTEGAPPITGCDVRVDLMHRGALMDSITTTLDDTGQVLLEGLPIGAGFTPVATVAYSGVTYLQRGEPMGPDHAIGRLDVTCYEVTSEVPAWSLGVRHVMLTRDADGIRVTEIVHVENPSDRTWLGTPRGYEKPATTSLVLPETAANVSLGAGFHEWCCTTLDDRTLINHLPLMPGTTEMTFSYRIRPAGAETPLTFGAPVGTGEATVIVPLNISAGAPRNLEEGGETRIADTDVRYFAASGLAPETGFGLTIATSWAAPAAGIASAGQISGATRWIAGVGAGCILIAAIVLTLLRRRAHAT